METLGSLRSYANASGAWATRITALIVSCSETEICSLLLPKQERETERASELVFSKYRKRQASNYNLGGDYSSLGTCKYGHVHGEGCKH